MGSEGDLEEHSRSEKLHDDESSRDGNGGSHHDGSHAHGASHSSPLFCQPERKQQERRKKAAMFLSRLKKGGGEEEGPVQPVYGEDNIGVIFKMSWVYYFHLASNAGKLTILHSAFALVR